MDFVNSFFPGTSTSTEAEQPKPVIISKPAPEVNKEKVCLTCKIGNRKQEIVGGVCLTCKQRNRKQNIV